MSSFTKAKRKLIPRIITGSYIGNGVDNRNIDIGINLLSKNNVFAFTKTSTGGEPSTWRSDIHSGDIASFLHAAADATNQIQAFTSTGFQIGNDNNVNFNGRVYRYVVIWEEP